MLPFHEKLATIRTWVIRHKNAASFAVVILIRAIGNKQYNA